ncbi:SsgA family sporulation/cell division regulator [Streptomyces sp. NPDC000994]
MAASRFMRTAAHRDHLSDGHRDCRADRFSRGPHGRVGAGPAQCSHCRHPTPPRPPNTLRAVITCVDHMLDTELVSPLGVRLRVPTQLLYRSQDPLVVEFLFHDLVRGPVPWAISRELLLRGLLAPSGEGDVRVWPTGTGPEALLHLRLTPPGGFAHLIAALPAVEHWLLRTYQLVPAAQETDALGLDLEGHLDRFLNGPS